GRSIGWQASYASRLAECGISGGRRTSRGRPMIEVYVESIRVNMTNYKRVVMLKEKTGPRYLPIWIGHFEADGIAIPMLNVPVSRPLSPDVLVVLVPILGWQWKRS